MSEKFKWLQFFADGAAGGDGDGGDGAGTGVDTGGTSPERRTLPARRDADRTLEELGVPRDKAERYRARKGLRAAADGVGGRQPGISAAAPSAGRSEAGRPTAEAARRETSDRKIPGPSWDDFFAIPENKQKLQNMMAERGKSATEAKAAADAQMEKLNPMFRLLGERYGIEAKDGVYDADAIVKAVTEDDSYYEDKALELGVTADGSRAAATGGGERQPGISAAAPSAGRSEVGPGTAVRQGEARQLEQADQMRQQQEREQARRQREAQLQEHFNMMQAQADALKKLYPDFDLQRELQNPEFVRRTAPGSGMSVEDAFYSIHHGEVMQRQAEEIALRARADAAAGYRANQARPRENGSSATGAVQAEPNLKAMTHEQRLAYIKAKYPRR